MRPSRTLLALVWMALASVQLSAARGQAGPDYVLGTDDVIEISVRDHPELTKVLQVMPDGKIAYPEVGELRASGKTPVALAAEIRAELEKSRNNVYVVVTVVTPKSQRVRIVGAVKAPGVVEFRRGMRLLDAIAVSGGLTTRPARVRGRVLRGSAEVIELRVSDAIDKPDSDSNLALQVDDLVLLDELDPMRQKVYVMGRVARAGAFDLGDEGQSVLAILAEAGNPTEDAALDKCTIIRGSEEIPVDLHPALVQGKTDDPVRSLQLRPGDLLFVPRNDQTISIMGSVNKSGQYPISPQKPLTVVDALGLAGGPAAAANTKRVSVMRMVDGRPTVTTLDLDRMISKKDFSANLALQKDDVVFVPAKGERGFMLQDILSPVSALYYLSRIGK